MRLVQIVPALSPPANGVGDYALRVAQELQAAHRLETSFLVCTPGWRKDAWSAPFAVEVLEERSGASLAHALARLAKSDGIALLQFSPYGYEPNGCPFWLVRGLRRWTERASAKLTTMFHELYAGGAPWSRAFWVAGLQKRAIKGILGCTDLAMTNMRSYASELQRWKPLGREVHCLPVPSNVGEPGGLAPISGRSRRACVFGISPGLRPLPSSGAPLLREALQSWSIEEIVLIGQSPVPETFRGMGCRVVVRQGLAADDVSSALSDCRLGLLSYPESALGKSGVYAAYSAHGVATVLLPVQGSGSASLDGPETGSHFLDIAGLAAARNPQRLQDVADNAGKWYRAHSVSAHAKRVANAAADLRQ